MGTQFAAPSDRLRIGCKCWTSPISPYGLLSCTCRPFAHSAQPADTPERPRRSRRRDPEPRTTHAPRRPLARTFKRSKFRSKRRKLRHIGSTVLVHTSANEVCSEVQLRTVGGSPSVPLGMVETVLCGAYSLCMALCESCAIRRARTRLRWPCGESLHVCARCSAAIREIDRFGLQINRWLRRCSFYAKRL